MYPAPFNYHRPETLQEAIGLMAELGEDAQAIAGGQSLIPMMKLRVGTAPEIIDIGRLPNLDYIELRGSTVHIGALARHADIAASDAAAQIPMLRDCAGGIADKQVRNMGTIGGGTAIADPALLPAGAGGRYRVHRSQRQPYGQYCRIHHGFVHDRARE
jgi:carbon-monoxide dehydrogenase medium subunit